MKKSQKTLNLLIIMFVTIAKAQAPFEDDVQDIPSASINSWIFVLIIIGFILAFYFLKNIKNDYFFVNESKF